MMRFPTLAFREWTGFFTKELVREPGRFGLGQIPTRHAPDTIAHAVCGFCSTGCNLKIHLRDGKPVNVSADTDYPVNLGMACPKGWEAVTPLAAPDRALFPLVRKSRGDEATRVTWDEAANIFCDRLKDVQARHGAEAVAFISTGQICTEEMAMLGAFAKFGMGVIHGDGNTRQCMATSVAAYKQSFGFDAPPFTYADFEESDVLVFVGANPCIAHPIMWQRVLRNQRNPEIIVIDPRKTETAMAATLHIPLAPKSDLALLYGVAHILVKNDWLDHEFLKANANGFDEFADFLQPYTIERTAEATGLSENVIQQIAAAIKVGKRVSFWWTMGVNQGHEATRTAQAIINLALMGGHIGKPGTGANSITGQCNAMGSRLFSNTTNLLGGHDFTNSVHREKVARATGIPVERIPDRPSWAYDQIIDGIDTGKIKGLWIIATNPAHSWIHQGRLKNLLGKLEFLVVQDMYHSTETAQHADLILPASGWGEKEGTFINSERRIGLVRPIAKPAGESKPDFFIFKLLAEKWGCGNLFQAWSSPEAVFQILKRCSAGQPCDITGIRDFEMMEEYGGVQWPCLESLKIPIQERRLFVDGKFYTKDHRAIFLFDSPQPMAETPDGDYPLLLLTGRGSSAQWHTETRTSKSAILRKLHPADLWLEIHPHDAKFLGISPSDWLQVQSRRGQVTARARISATTQPGQVFLPMHHRDVNTLTHATFDPHSRQPSYKACAVRVVK